MRRADIIGGADPYFKVTVPSAAGGTLTLVDTEDDNKKNTRTPSWKDESAYFEEHGHCTAIGFHDFDTTRLSVAFKDKDIWFDDDLGTATVPLNRTTGQTPGVVANGIWKFDLVRDGDRDDDEWVKVSVFDEAICWDDCSGEEDGVCTDGGESTEPICGFGWDCEDCGSRTDHIRPPMSPTPSPPPPPSPPPCSPPWPPVAPISPQPPPIPGTCGCPASYPCCNCYSGWCTRSITSTSFLDACQSGMDGKGTCYPFEPVTVDYGCTHHHPLCQFYPPLPPLPPPAPPAPTRRKLQASLDCSDAYAIVDVELSVATSDAEAPDFSGMTNTLTSASTVIVACSSQTLASVKQDPHLSLAHGARADWRGVAGIPFAFLSAPTMHVAVVVQESLFGLHEGRLTVNGTFISDVFVKMHDDASKEVRVSYHADLIDPKNNFGLYAANASCNADPFIVHPHTHTDCGPRLSVRRKYSTIVLENEFWATRITPQPVYNRISGLRTRFDVDFEPRRSPGVAVHGILGQGFQVGRLARNGSVDTYPDSGYFRTTAMAEGALDGSTADYRLRAPFDHSFKFNMFRPSGPRT